MVTWRKGVTGLWTGAAGPVPETCGPEFKVGPAGRDTSEFHPKQLPAILIEKAFTAALFIITKQN